MAAHQLKVGWGKRDMSKMGLEEGAQMATHILKAGQGGR